MRRYTQLDITLHVYFRKPFKSFMLSFQHLQTTELFTHKNVLKYVQTYI